MLIVDSQASMIEWVKTSTIFSWTFFNRRAIILGIKMGMKVREYIKSIFARHDGGSKQPIIWDFLIFLAYISPQYNNLSSQNNTFTNTTIINSRLQFEILQQFPLWRKSKIVEPTIDLSQQILAILINNENTFIEKQFEEVVLKFVELEIIFIIFIPPSTGKYVFRLNKKTLL